MSSFRLKLVFVCALIAASALIAAACGDDKGGEPTPFSLGGDSKVVGFTPTPTARFPVSGPTSTPAPPTQTSGPGTQPPGGGGDADAGKQLFLTRGCTGCHTIEGLPGATGNVGPNLTRVGTTAATRKPGTAADAYLHESIEAPGAFLAPGFPNAMPPGLVSGPDVDKVVAYLLTLK